MPPISGHSLRAGMVTQAMEHFTATCHRSSVKRDTESLDMFLKYLRSAKVFVHNASSKLGL